MQNVAKSFFLSESNRYMIVTLLQQINAKKEEDKNELKGSKGTQMTDAEQNLVFQLLLRVFIIYFLMKLRKYYTPVLSPPLYLFVVGGTVTTPNGYMRV